jgi:hypothetical protein
LQLFSFGVAKFPIMPEASIRASTISLVRISARPTDFWAIRYCPLLVEAMYHIIVRVSAPSQ